MSAPPSFIWRSDIFNLSSKLGLVGCKVCVFPTLAISSLFNPALPHLLNNGFFPSSAGPSLDLNLNSFASSALTGIPISPNFPPGLTTSAVSDELAQRRRKGFRPVPSSGLTLS